MSHFYFCEVQKEIGTGVFSVILRGRINKIGKRGEFSLVSGGGHSDWQCDRTLKLFDGSMIAVTLSANQKLDKCGEWEFAMVGPIAVDGDLIVMSVDLKKEISATGRDKPPVMVSDMLADAFDKVFANRSAA